MNENERAILAACLHQPELFGQVSETLGPDDFTPQAKLLYLAIRTLAECGDAVDEITVRHQLRKTGEFEQVGAQWFATFDENLPVFSSESFKTWLGIVKEAAKRLRIVREASKLSDLCLDPSVKSEGLISQIQAIAFDVDKEASRSNSYDPVRLKEVGEAALEEIKTATHGIIGIPSGLLTLDRMTGGFRKGQYIAIGARPSVGKSSLGLQIAQNAADEGHTVAFFSLEMEAAELTMIRACARARVSKFELQNSGGTHHMFPKMKKVMGELAQTPLHVEKLYAPGLGPIRARAARMKAKHGIDLVIIDYIQLMRSDSGKNATRNDELTEISSGIKAMAGVLGAPVIVIAQLNRQAAKGDDRPQLSHFRDSGSIEADADVALLLHRMDEEQERSLPIDVDLIVAKNRTGSCGVVKLKFDGPYQTFTEPDYE